MKGKILRVKHGYNPNSSSMGSIIFALPVSMIAITFGMAAASGLIFSYFIKDDSAEDDPEAAPSNKKEQTEKPSSN